MQFPDDTPDPGPRGNLVWVVRLILIAGLIAAIGLFYKTNIARRPTDALDDAAVSAKCVKPYHGMRVVKDTILCTGLYFLYGDASDAITIAADNVSLIGRDTRMVGNRESVGIRVLSENNTVNGCILIGFRQGIAANQGGSGLQVRHVRIDNVTENFIQLLGSGAYELRHIEINDVWLSRSKRGGLICDHCRDSIIRRVQYMNDEPTAEPAMHLAACRDTLIENNVIYSLGGQAGTGIWVVDSTGVTVEGNIVRMAGAGEGAHVVHSTGATFRYNKIVVDRLARSLVLDPQSTGNRFVANAFRNGQVLDQGSGNVWCVAGRGNWFLNGASYSGPDANHGACAR